MSLSAANKSRIVRAYLRYISTTKHPIVLGPWRSELGFEVLYWMPFLAWALKRYQIAPERCLALSRGGMGNLYHVPHVADLYTVRTVDQVRLENLVDYESRKMLKQTSVTTWDRQVAFDALEQAQLPTSHHLLHPSWMYWLFEDWWEERASMPLIAQHTDYRPMPLVNLPDGFTLPSRFVAVRFYARHTFPMSPDVQQMAQQMVAGIAAHTPVVLLNQSLYADDHVDFLVSGEQIFQLPTVTPETNFLVQAAVLSRAQAFVGTYGGVAQWALRYGKPSLSCFTSWSGTALAHWTLSRKLAQYLKVPFEVCDLSMAPLWKLTWSQVEATVQRGSSGATPEPVPESIPA